ncbi:hypothetical protein QTI24_02280 [Variovorax sp. J22P240]|nr:hypothetical protein [Variovorax sp. J22P240]MDL9997412.1 hypothetical protein [Variovorax sp. J22P240]
MNLSNRRSLLSVLALALSSSFGFAADNYPNRTVKQAEIQPN